MIDPAEKARRLLDLHAGPKLLVLPNVWDPLGARMLERLGYPAVATASASIAWSLGVDDGERLDFEAMLSAIGRIAAAVDVPVTADVESGYAEAPETVAANVRRVLEAGAVGVNLEDADPRTGRLYSIERQCERLRAVREAADAAGVHLVVNARTDAVMRRVHGDPERDLAEAVERSVAYLEAGADCVYPITVGDVDRLVTILEATDGAPINVYASPDAAPMADLEAIGIRRLSLGPGLLKASLTAMRAVAEDLLGYGPYDRFTSDAVTTAEIQSWLDREG